MKKINLSISLIFTALFWIMPFSVNAIGVEPTGTDLSVSIFDVNDPVSFGDPINYQISVFNVGPQPTDQVNLFLGTESGGSILQVLFTSGPTGTCFSAPSVTGLNCEILLLNAGQESILDLLFLPEEAGEILFFAAVSGPLNDPAEENDNDFEATFYQSPVSAIPVPAAVWLFGTSLIGLAGFSRRRKAA